MNLRPFIERHPFGRWFFNFLLIAVVFFMGAFNYIRISEWRPVLCASKANLQVQIDDAWIKLNRQEDFLYEWDTGNRPHIRGITRADIVLGISDTMALIDRLNDSFMAYKTLDCK